MSLSALAKILYKKDLVLILKALEDTSFAASWKKEKLVHQLSNHSYSKVVKTLTADQLGKALEQLGEDSSGTKSARQKRLLKAFSAAAEAPQKSKASSQAKKQPKDESTQQAEKLIAFLKQGKDGIQQGLLLFESSESSTQEQVLSLMGAKSPKPYTLQQLVKNGFVDSQSLKKRTMSYTGGKFVTKYTTTNHPHKSNFSRVSVYQWNLPVILHILSNSKALQKADVLTLYLDAPMQQDVLDYLLRDSCAHINRIRIMVEPIPKIDSAPELKPFVCVESDEFLSKIREKKPVAQWSLRDFALVGVMPWLEELELTADPKEERPSFVEIFDAYFLATRYKLGKYPPFVAYQSWFWKRRSYVELTAERCSQLNKLTVHPNRTLVELSSEAPCLEQIDIQESCQLHNLKTNAVLKKLSLNAGAERPKMKYFSIDTTALSEFHQDHSLRGGLLPATHLTDNASIVAYFKQQNEDHVVLRGDGAVDECFYLYYLEDRHSRSSFKDRTGVAYEDVGDMSNHPEIFNGDPDNAVWVDKMSFSFPFLVQELKHIASSKECPPNFTEFLDDNVLLHNGDFDNSSSFAISINPADPAKQITREPFDDIVPNPYGDVADIRVIAREKNTHPNISALKDRYEEIFDGDCGMFEMYYHPMLELLEYLKDEEVEMLSSCFK